MSDADPPPPSDEKKLRAPRKGHGRATLDDVARRAGVSPITVSRALRSPGGVASATRQRIADAVMEVGYIPNLIAGSLASSAPRTVAAILPTLDNSIFTDVLKGVVDVLGTSDYQLVLGNSHWSLEVEEALVTTFLSHRVGAIMLTGAAHSPRTREILRTAQLPVVETWSLPRSPVGACVGFSNERAAFAMTQHLIERGYRDIALVSAVTRHNDRAAARRRGYARALRTHGLHNAPETTLESSFGLAAGAAALERIRRVRPSTDAIFFANDVLASGAILGALRGGLRVPDDIAIAGFDDTEMATEMIPPLTTVRVEREVLGAAAGELMLAALRGEDIRGRRIDIGFEVIARSST